jgi:primosomal protein N' (replication factor Y)
MKTLRAGVSRLREEVAALLGVEVGEVSGPARSGPSGRSGAAGTVPATPVLIGTEAVLHRVRRAAAVAFLDIDLHLLAPRFSATDETLALLVRAVRLVGPAARRPGFGPDAGADAGARSSGPAGGGAGGAGRSLAEEESMRRSAGLPPFSALAALSGPLAAGYADGPPEAAGAGRRA